MLARALRGRSAATFALLAAALALVPFDWENALWGFQAQLCAQATLEKNLLGLGPSLIALALLLYCLAQLRLARARAAASD